MAGETKPKPDMLGSGGAGRAGSTLAGRRKQLDELEKASMGDGAFGVKKRRKGAMASKKCGGSWPW